MRYVAAYLLAVLGSNQNPSAADIDKILGAVGVESDAEKVKKVISELSGKSVEEVIKQGMVLTWHFLILFLKILWWYGSFVIEFIFIIGQEKLATMPAGGGGAAAPAAAAASAPAAAKKGNLPIFFSNMKKCIRVANDD